MNEEKQKAIRALETARGQLGGIINMIEGGRYCIDVSNQILASTAMLKKANLLILRQHMEHCLIEAVREKNEKEKIDEIVKILSKIMEK